MAILFEPVPPSEVLVLAAYGLADRETQLTLLALRGHSTGEIATGLAISPFIMQQRLKAVFDKVGVRSRRELVARIFAQQYPRPR